ncbi:integrase [Paracoccus aminovorans]|nr:integrase [Paracoccus aminovorans]
MIERDHPALSDGVQCRLLSISRSSFYHEPTGLCCTKELMAGFPPSPDRSIPRPL